MVKITRWCKLIIKFDFTNISVWNYEITIGIKCIGNMIDGEPHKMLFN